MLAVQNLSSLLFYTTLPRQARPIVVRQAPNRGANFNASETLRKMTYIVLAIVAALTAALVWLWWTATDLDQQVDFKSTVLNPKPNQFLICPDKFCKDTPHQIAPIFKVPMPELQRKWDEMMEQEKGFIRLDMQEGATRRHYHKRTDMLRFPDRITVEFVAVDDTTSSIAIYSRSKYGYSDGGLNQARTLDLLGELETRIK